MKDYSAMSDEDINKLVAGHISFADKVMVGTGQIDYCNNPADAWPIITENKISIIHDGGENEYTACYGFKFEYGCWDLASIPEHYHTHGNPLRAAMVAFLKIKDRESSHA
ncbi:TPA: phage protein NinX family protein [Yersinia enterocolitica]